MCSRKIMHLSILLMLTAGFLWAYSAPKRKILPPSDTIHSSLQSDPIQEKVERESYRFDYMGSSYSIFPRADYEIWGMVVTQNDITSIANIYHTSSSVDFKDLCVIWGRNLTDEIYKEVTFWSDPFTCWYRPQTQRASRAFSGDYLSNNHLLSRSKSVRDKVNSINIGDQIYARGYLIDYCPAGRPDYMRKTSLVRTDTGPGACEVMMIEEFDILFRNQPFWNQVFAKSKFAFWLLLVLTPLLWLGWIFQERKEQKKALLKAQKSYRRRFGQAP